MSTILIVIIDIVVGIIAIFASQSIWQLVSFLGFEIPFTNEMISAGIIKEDVKKQLLFVEGFSGFIMFILLNGLCVLGAFFARPSGFIVYGVVFVIALVFFKPTKDRYTRSSYNINHYAQSHCVCMDMDRFKQLYM